MADDSGGGSSNVTVAVIALASALIGAVAGGVGNYFTFASKDQELKVHLVEIAIGILRADPKEDVTPARGWALNVIEKNSGVPFSDQDREALLHKPLDTLTAAQTQDMMQMLMQMVSTPKPSGEQSPPQGK